MAETAGPQKIRSQESSDPPARAELKLTYPSTTYARLLKKYQETGNLSPNELLLLQRNKALLAKHPEFDRLFSHFEKSFYARPPVINYAQQQQFSRRQLEKVYANLQQAVFRHHSVITVLTFEQLKQLRNDLHQLIFYHGNPQLSGSPSFAGGVPHVFFVQFGNLFGIVKFQELPSEKTLKGNLLIQFEDMQDRNLEQCVENYNLQQQHLAKDFQQVQIHSQHNIFHPPANFSRPGPSATIENRSNEYLVTPVLTPFRRTLRP